VSRHRNILKSRRNALCLLLFLVLLCCSGCEVITKLRSIFHPEEAAAGNGGSSEIELLIQPSTNIEVFLDGEPIATESPYIATHLKAEKHQLHIESEGFHPFSLIFDLPENKKLSLPIALRKKAAAPAKDGKGGQPNSGGYDRGPPTGAGVKPAQLSFRTNPPEPVRWDGEELNPPESTLDRLWGVLEAGPLKTKYRYSKIGILEFTIPEEKPAADESITWLKDRTPLKPGESFRLPKGATQLIRISTLTGRQILIIERP